MTARHSPLNHSVSGRGSAPPAKSPPAHYTAAQNRSFNAWIKKHPFKGASGAAPAKNAKKASHAKKAKRGFTPDDVMQICASRAVAEAIRIASGRPLSDFQVLAMHWQASEGTGGPVPILAALEAASGLAPLRCEPADVIAPGVILGISAPGAHTVTVGRDGEWWSWGEPFDPWPADIEEAWAVSLT